MSWFAPDDPGPSDNSFIPADRDSEAHGLFCAINALH